MVINRGKVSKLEISKENHLNNVIRHQFKENFNMMFFVRGRIEGLLYPLLSIPWVRRMFKTGKILSIGPRNEGEVLLLSKLGFDWKNITAIDLFSYSPKITLMDMHQMTFPDNSFDIVISSWVLRYSYSIEKAVNEMIRVAKNGSYIAIGMSYGDDELIQSSRDAESVITKLDGGLHELLEFFGDHLDTVHWKMEYVKGNQTDITTVFKIKK